nr:ATP-binding protein [Mangrovactinospora gilvigrisea]
MPDDSPRRRRGRLKVFLGAAPGVGKTYRMLDEGRRRAERGTDVVVAFVECHARPRTERMKDGLEIVPRALVAYRGGEFGEMDVAAVLARAPEVALVDELAHTNVPGSGNAKRWQDVHELLDAGIDVVTTVNVQHLESLNDVVEHITGVPQRETVPDGVVRGADQVELVDMAAEALRRRMAHGNVYAPDKVDAALSHYFRVGNLTALRELALLWVADRVDEALTTYRGEHGIRRTWEARERVVVALTGGPEGPQVIRRAARIAERAAAGAGGGTGTLIAVHVARSDGLVGASPAALTEQRRLVESLGGSFHSVVGTDIPTALIEFARSENATQLVMGTSRRSRWQRALGGPGIGQTTTDLSGDIDVHMVTHTEAGTGRRRLLPVVRRPGLRRLAGPAAGVVLPTLLTLGLTQVRGQVNLVGEVLAYLLGVVAVALLGGVVSALVGSVVASLLLNYWFIPPIHRFTIDEQNNVLALAIFAVVAVAVAMVVDRAGRLGRRAAHASATAEALTALAGGVLRGDRAVESLLEQTRDTFALQHVALRRTAPDGAMETVAESRPAAAQAATGGAGGAAGRTPHHAAPSDEPGTLPSSEPAAPPATTPLARTGAHARGGTAAAAGSTSAHAADGADADDADDAEPMSRQTTASDGHPAGAGPDAARDGTGGTKPMADGGADAQAPRRTAASDGRPAGARPGTMAHGELTPPPATTPPASADAHAPRGTAADAGSTSTHAADDPDEPIPRQATASGGHPAGARPGAMADGELTPPPATTPPASADTHAPRATAADAGSTSTHAADDPDNADEPIPHQATASGGHPAGAGAGRRRRRGGRFGAASGGGGVTVTRVGVDAGAELVLEGRVLSATDKRVLGTFAAHLAAALERARLAEAAAEASAEAERADTVDRTRAALLAAVGHDLRTPLAAGYAAVSSLRSSDVEFSDADRDELLAAAEESLARLGRLLDKLLDASRLQAGEMPVHPETVRLEDVVRLALDTLPEDACRAVELHGSDAVPAVRADPALLERVVAGLVGNAVRHSPPGATVRVAASALADRVELRIADRGPGLPAGAEARMADPFRRIRTDAERSGYGLGLAVSRGLTEAMGGSLAPEDTPGGGLTMVVSLPVAQLPHQAPRESASAPA